MGTIICFVYDEMADFEITLALHLIRTRGKREVVTVGYERTPVKSQAGLTYVPDATLSDALEMQGVAGGRRLQEIIADGDAVPFDGYALDPHHGLYGIDYLWGHFRG